MNIALLISGGGTTAQAVIQSSQQGQLKDVIKPAVVISSNTNAGGIQKAKDLKVPVEVVQRENYTSGKEFGTALLQLFSQYDVELISQNGWLPLTPKNVIEKFNRKIINQHPGPLDPGRPDFGGKGMYGARVTGARIIYCMLTSEKHPWTEAITHFVTEEFDRGNLIHVKKLEFDILHENIHITTVEQDNDLQLYIKKKTQDIQQILLPLEHENVIETLAVLANGSIPEFNRSVPLIPHENKEFLLQAKGLAIKLFPQG